MANTIIIYTLLTSLFMILIGCFVMLVKNDITFRNHNIITDAIFKYKMYCIDNFITPEVDWSDMKDYNKTFWCLLDWGYTKILPADKFEIIKPFIGKEDESCQDR